MSRRLCLCKPYPVVPSVIGATNLPGLAPGTRPVATQHSLPGLAPGTRQNCVAQAETVVSGEFGSCSFNPVQRKIAETVISKRSPGRVRGL